MVLYGIPIYAEAYHYIGTLLRCCNDLVETYLRFGKRFYTRINCGFIVEIFTQMRINSIILYTRGDNGSINYRTIYHRVDLTCRPSGKLDS